MKQETIEEAIENRIKGINVDTGFRIERSYSEKDMIEFAYYYNDERKNKGARAMTPELLIKQFKKK